MPFTEVMFSYFYSLYQYVQTTWPVSIIYGPKYVMPSEETKDKILKIISLMKVNQDKTCKVFPLLKNLPTGEDWLGVTDVDSGFDILQHAVLNRRKDIIVYLIKHGCDPGRYSCSPPVHLAAYLGDENILKLLFDYGAKGSAKRGMCYPESHVPISYEARYFSFTEHPVYLCKSHRLTPAQCAIQKDNLSCAQAIIKKEGLGSRRDLNPHNLLMYACKEGAPNCIQNFVDRFPECINSYLDGDTPLLAAVPWGEQCVSILLESGADVHLRSEFIQETALHRLYRQNIDCLFTIYDSTKYLLTTGIEQEVNAYTHLGETPLHMLVSHVSYTGGNYVDPQRRIPRAQLQEDYQKQVLAGIRLLLEFNADPHLLNSPGLTSLSRMLHIGLKAVHPEDKCECVESSQPNMFISDYKHDYDNLAEAMEILFDYGSKPNFSCQVGHTPLILMLQLLLYDDLANICPQHKQVVRAVEVLLKNGADPNFTDGGQGTAFSLVAFICRRCFQSNGQTLNGGLPIFDGRHNPPQSLREQFADVMNDVLAVLLKYNLEPNHVSTKISQHLRGGQGNGLIEFLRLAGFASSSMEFEAIGKWIQTLLHGGADPDVEPYPSEPIICHCQSSIFLKKLGTQPLSHYIHEVKDKESLLDKMAVKRLLLVFYHTMDHHTLHNCLSAIKSLVHLRPLGLNSTGVNTPLPGSPYTTVTSLANDLDFLSMINAMNENPRSLKEIARVCIYKSMDRQLADSVPHLPLPHIVKRYLLEPVS